jgi:hypothetical protein
MVGEGIVKSAEIMRARQRTVKLILKWGISTAFLHQYRTCTLRLPRSGEYLSRKNHINLIFENGIIFGYAKFYFDANVVKMN